MPYKRKRKTPTHRRKKQATPKGYDSYWEYELHTSSLSRWLHHECEISYVISHTYKTDFTRQIAGKTIHIEAKGRFRERAEASKYLWIRDHLEAHEELVFVFQTPYAAMPHAKRRKCGTKQSHAEWAEKNNFRWYTAETIPKEWR